MCRNTATVVPSIISVLFKTFLLTSGRIIRLVFKKIWDPHPNGFNAISHYWFFKNFKDDRPPIRVHPRFPIFPPFEVDTGIFRFQDNIRFDVNIEDRSSQYTYCMYVIVQTWMMGSKTSAKSL